MDAIESSTTYATVGSASIISIGDPFIWALYPLSAVVPCFEHKADRILRTVHTSVELSFYMELIVFICNEEIGRNLREMCCAVAFLLEDPAEASVSWTKAI
jgi:hypothetical protein